MSPYLEYHLKTFLDKVSDPTRRPENPMPRWRNDRKVYGNPTRGGWRGPGGTHSASQGPQRDVHMVNDDQGPTSEEEQMAPWVEGDEEDDLQNEEKSPRLVNYKSAPEPVNRRRWVISIVLSKNDMLSNITRRSKNRRVTNPRMMAREARIAEIFGHANAAGSTRP